MVVDEIFLHVFAHTVITRLADKVSRYAGTSQRDDCVECRTARYGTLRLVVLEDDVKNRLSYSDNFSHNGRKGTKKSEKWKLKRENFALIPVILN